MNIRRGFQVFPPSSTFKRALIYLSFSIEAKLYSKGFPKLMNQVWESCDILVVLILICRIHRFKLELWGFLVGIIRE